MSKYPKKYLKNLHRVYETLSSCCYGKSMKIVLMSLYTTLSTVILQEKCPNNFDSSDLLGRACRRSHPQSKAMCTFRVEQKARGRGGSRERLRLLRKICKSHELRRCLELDHCVTRFVWSCGNHV